MEKKGNMGNFTYTYSAREYGEVEAIRKRYLRKSDDKLEQMRKIDAAITSKACIVAMTLGVVGTLVLGGGMSCSMVWPDTLMLLGIIIGIVGIAILLAAYPVYVRMLEKGRERAAEEILRLADEITRESNT